MRNTIAFSLIALFAGSVSACAPTSSRSLVVPAMDYAQRVKQQMALGNTTGSFQSMPARGFQSPSNGGSRSNPAVYPSTLNSDSQVRARVRFASDELPPEDLNELQGSGAGTRVTNQNNPDEGFTTYESTNPTVRDYTGPLSVGDPGVSASLWKESRGGNDLFRDYRAWQPMDLITIVVSESAEGKKQADTEVKQKSTVEAAIDSLFTLSEDFKAKNKGLDPSSLIQASTQNDFKGEGQTNRKDSLKARISAMVVEVLPGGVLRIEGERIISVNAEEQTMVISGLVRPQDVNSINEVDSSKIANMRIDYYGSGTVDEAQHGGWLGRFIRRVWPF